MLETMFQSLAWLFLYMICSRAQIMMDATPPMMMSLSSSSSSDAPPPNTRSCEEEIRHCDQLLATKDETCAELRRASFQQCDDLLLKASKEAAAQAHAAHQAELQKLHDIVTQIRGQKDSFHTECEQRVADSYSNGWREAQAVCQQQLNASQEATLQSQTAHQTEIDRLTSLTDQSGREKETMQTVHQTEINRLTSLIDQSRQEKETMQTVHQTEIDRLTSIISQSRQQKEVIQTSHQTEIDRLTSIIDQSRQQKEMIQASCERSVTESYATGFREGNAISSKQLQQAAQQLASAKLLTRIRHEHWIVEKARLEKENQELYGSLSRLQNILLETQRELTRANDEMKAQWTILCIWNEFTSLIVQTWDSYLAAHVQTLWEAYGKEPWENYGLARWEQTQALYTKCRIHAFLAMNLAFDLAKISISEIVFIVKTLPETAPQLWQQVLKALEPLQTQTRELYEQNRSSLRQKLVSNILTAKTKMDSIWYQIKEELHLEKMDPYIEAVKKEMDNMDRVMTPLFERSKRVWESLMIELNSLWQSMKHESLKSGDRIGTIFSKCGSALEKRKKSYVEDFSLSARTVFLLLRVYNAPKFTRDIAEFCHSQPEAAIWTFLQYTIFIVGCFLLVRLFMPGRRKRCSQRKVQFAVTQ